MRYFSLLLLIAFCVSCNERVAEGKGSDLKAWIIANEQKLKTDSDSLIQDYLIRSIMDSGWISVSLVVTSKAPNSLGALSKKLNNSTGCIVTELTFFNNESRKRTIMLAAEDSTCSDILKDIALPADSVQSFLFGVRNRPLY